MTNQLDRAVPTHLRPDSWDNLCAQLATAGWQAEQAAQRLGRAATQADGPGYIRRVIEAMLREPPATQPTLTPAPPPRLHIAPHPYQPDPAPHPGPYCARCGLPPHNRHHT